MGSCSLQAVPDTRSGLGSSGNAVDGGDEAVTVALLSALLGEVEEVKEVRGKRHEEAEKDTMCTRQRKR